MMTIFRCFMKEKFYLGVFILLLARIGFEENFLIFLIKMILLFRKTFCSGDIISIIIFYLYNVQHFFKKPKTLPTNSNTTEH